MLNLIPLSRARRQKLLKSLSSLPIEFGGIIGARKNKIVCFYADPSYQGNDFYVPNVDILNRVICDWHTEGIRFAGIVHTHPNGFHFLSADDKKYACDIIETCRIEYVYFPIVTRKNRRKLKMDVYMVSNNESIKKQKIIVVPW